MKNRSSSPRKASLASRRSRARTPGFGNGPPSQRPQDPKPAAELAGWLAKPKRNLIGGKWAPAASGKCFDALNPADGSVLARVPDSGK